MYSLYSFLLLLGIAMPLKYVWGDPSAVRMVGMAHGVLFCLFCAALLNAMLSEKWSIKPPALIFLASHRPEQTVPPHLQQVRETFRRHGIRFATLDRRCYTAAGEEMVCRLLDTGLGGELVHQDRHFLTYRFDPATTLASAR